MSLMSLKLEKKTRTRSDDDYYNGDDGYDRGWEDMGWICFRWRLLLVD